MQTQIRVSPDCYGVPTDIPATVDRQKGENTRIAGLDDILIHQYIYQ